MNAQPKLPRKGPARQPAKPDPIFGARPRHELEFLPAALEVIESPVPPLPRIAALTLVALLAAVLAWAVLGRVDVIATAPGRIVPTGGSKVVQPLETGTVTAIRVHDGMVVHKGDVLVELEPTETESDRARTGGELAAARLEVARLRAVALGAPFQVPPGTDPKAAAIAGQEARAEIEDREAKLQGLADEVSQHQAALEGAKAEVDRLTTLMPLAQQRSKIYSDLAAQGFGSSLQMIEAEEKRQDNAKSLEVQRRRIPELEAQVHAAERALAQARADAAKTALASLTEIQVKAASLSDDLSKATERNRDRTLLAPVDGAVQELAIHTVGGVVEPGQTLMRIAPADSPVEVEARLSNQDIGFVHAGMAAEIKVQTFPFTRYGLIHASILSISRDAVTDPKPQENSADGAPPANNDLRYLMRLRLDRDSITVDGKPTRLTPGMMVTAEVKTGRRRVIQFVLSPLAKATQEAGRER
jgi:hemolysin D